MAQRKIRRVLLLVGTDTQGGRDVIRGAMRFADHCGNWLLHQVEPVHVVPFRLDLWQPHGVLAHLWPTPTYDAVRQLSCPIVDISSRSSDDGIPRIRIDDYRIGKVAAEHFLARHLRHFGYIGFSDASYVRYEQRLAGFRDTLRRAGFDCRHYVHAPPSQPPGPDLTDQTGQHAVDAWLRELGRPAAVLASNDSLARELTQHCQHSRIAVPDELAIVGVGDDEFICGLSHPPLSSVRLGMSRVGWEAARLLLRMMDGRRPRRLTIPVPPLDVAVRQSSDTLAVQDDEVRAALRYISERLGEPISVPDVAESVALSRSMLGKKFRRALGRSPVREVRRLRVSAAQRLLADTALPLKEIARRCGFGSAVRFSMLFRRETGLSPTSYRRRHSPP